MDKILVTGASGHFGKATIEFLLEKGVLANSITALVRDEAKAEDIKSKGVILKKGDYNHLESLVAAFAGIDKLLLVSTNDINNRVEQHKNVVDAAKKAGIKHIFYTSFVRKNETETSPIAFIAQQHLQTETLIKESGISYTFLLNGLYADVLPMFFGEKVLETGIFLPAAHGKAGYTVRIDMAEAAANLLLSNGHEGKSYELTNTENLSMNNLAEILSKVSGKKVNYLNPTVEAFTQAMTDHGVPADTVGFLAAFNAAIAQGEFEPRKSDLDELLGRKATSMETFLSTIYSNN